MLESNEYFHCPVQTYLQSYAVLIKLIYTIRCSKNIIIIVAAMIISSQLQYTQKNENLDGIVIWNME